MPADIPITEEMVEAALDEWNTTVHLPTQRDSMHAALSAALAASALPRVVEASQGLLELENSDAGGPRFIRALASAIKELDAALAALKGGGDAG